MEFIKKHRTVIGIIVVILIAIWGYRYINRGTYAVQNKIMHYGLKMHDEVSYSDDMLVKFNSNHKIQFESDGKFDPTLSKGLTWSAQGNKVYIRMNNTNLSTIDVDNKISFKGHAAYKATFDIMKMFNQTDESYGSAITDYLSDDYSGTFYFIT